MVSGAPRPGGPTAPAPGGLNAPPPGGLNMNIPSTQTRLGGYPFAWAESSEKTKANATIVTVGVGVRFGLAASATYAWTIPTKPGGSVATLTTPTAQTSTFTPDGVGTYVFQCVVTFNTGQVSTVLTTVKAT